MRIVSIVIGSIMLLFGSSKTMDTNIFDALIVIFVYATAASLIIIPLILEFLEHLAKIKKDNDKELEQKYENKLKFFTKEKVLIRLTKLRIVGSIVLQLLTFAFLSNGFFSYFNAKVSIATTILLFLMSWSVFYSLVRYCKENFEKLTPKSANYLYNFVNSKVKNKKKKKSQK